MCLFTPNKGGACVYICIKNGLKVLLAKQNYAGETYTLKSQDRRFCFTK